MDFKNLDNLLKHFTEIGPCGVACSVTRDGEVLYEKYQGRKRTDSDEPVKEDTLFRVYSSSKVITAASAMILYEQGKFVLDDPVANYLPEFKDAKYYDYNGSDFTQALPLRNPLTIRQLMTMTSGIPYGGTNNQSMVDVDKIGGMFPIEPKPLREFVKELAAIPFCFEPGTHWNYGFGLDITGALVEVISGMDLASFMKKEIFDPLGMKDTGFTVDDANWHRLAGLYNFSTGKLVEDEFKDFSYKPGYPFYSGGGGIVSTLQDMTKFSMMMACGGTLNGTRILNERTVRLMGSNHIHGQALEDYKKVHRTTWPNMYGYGYGLGVRSYMDPVVGGCMIPPGEFGWSGAAGTYTLIDPNNHISIDYMQQVIPPDHNLQGYCQPRIRNVVYSILD